MNVKMTTFRLARIAIFSALLFIQEELLNFLPNVQLTQCLITIYFFAFGFSDTLIIVLIHVLLDNLVMGSFNLVYTPAMFIGWISLVVILYLFRNIKNKWIISLIVGLHAFLYSWVFLVANIVVLKTPFLEYFLSDIPFELILALNGFVTTLLLAKPLVNILNKLKINNKEIKEAK